MSERAHVYDYMFSNNFGDNTLCTFFLITVYYLLRIAYVFYGEKALHLFLFFNPGIKMVLFNMTCCVSIKIQHVTDWKNSNAKYSEKLL